MSASALMSIATRAMSANYAALQTTGHNIANANTEGYSRQSTVFESSGSQYTGSGFFGKGVDVATVERAHDAFLTSEVLTSKSIAAADDARSTQLKLLENVFPLGESGLGYATTQMFDAFVDVANDPSDSSSRQVALSRAGELATRLRSASDQIDSLQQGVAQDLQISVKQVNSLASQIASLNQKIVAATGAGQTPNDLLDQRDKAISDLSQYLAVTTVDGGDGSKSVFIGGGQKLVLGSQASTLVAMADPYDSSRLQIGVNDSGSVRALSEGLISGGSIGGLLRFQNDDLVDARNQLGQFTAAVTAAVNEQQALGLDGGQPPSAGAALFSIGAARVLPASTNTGGSSVSISVTDASQLQASDYELKRDPALPAGSYTLTRLSDGMQQTVTDGAVVDGFQITIGTPAPADNDRFLLQPVARAASGAALALADPKGIAAASPVSATLGSANTGTASVAALSATAANASAAPLTATITFTNGSGAYDWELRDASNSVVRSGSGTWTAGQPIRSDSWTPTTPAQAYDWSLELSGVPASGDTLTIGATTSAASNNGNARAMYALRDSALVGRTGASSGGASATDAYANLLADVGVRVQTATSAAAQSSTVADAAQAALSSKVGVNLDEEAARLLQFQQSYQAAAKILQVAQSLFDTLLQTAGG